MTEDPAVPHPMSARIDRHEIEGRVWTFGPVDRASARQVRLLADGRVSGASSGNDFSWDLRDRLLTLFGRHGEPMVRFEHRRRSEHGIVLCGRSMRHPSSVLVLAQTRPVQTLASDMSGFRLDHHVHGTVTGRRRNLVVVFGNYNSLHRHWHRDIADTERTWDVCVSFYGSPHRYDQVGPAEFSILQTGATKCAAAHAAFAADSPFWAYERVWLADDDLMIGWRDINLMFSLAEEYNLQLAQPALLDGSYIAHAITRQQPGKLLRFTSFVEAMAPVFTREALRVCVPVYQDQRHGYGTDYVWPWLLSAPRHRIAIIDKVGMAHTRPQTTAYDPATIAREEHRLLSMYGVQPVVREYGFLLDTGEEAPNQPRRTIASASVRSDR